MRVLLVSPFQPHPGADHGGGVYLGLLLQEMHAHANVGVVHYGHRGDPPPMPGIPAFTTPRLRTAEVGSRDRWRQRARHVRDWGLRGVPLEVAKLQSAAFRDTLRGAVDSFRPDVALVEFAVMAWCLPDLRGTTTVLTDHERGSSVPRRIGPGGWGVRRDRMLWRRYVEHFYPLADLVQALTAEDAAALTATTGLPVEVRSPMIAIPDAVADRAATGPVMVFFGDYLHHPNRETAQRLAVEVLPRVRAGMPAAELWLAGPRADHALRELGALPGVRFLGFVDDLTAVLAQARCVVAPVWSGYGVRSKSMLGMAHGLPLVANALGVQGIDPPAAACARGESPAELAAACLHFLRDPATAAAAGAVARRFIQDTRGGTRLAEQQLLRFEALRR